MKEGEETSRHWTYLGLATVCKSDLRVFEALHSAIQSHLYIASFHLILTITLRGEC